MVVKTKKQVLIQKIIELKQLQPDFLISSQTSEILSLNKQNCSELEIALKNIQTPTSIKKGRVKWDNEMIEELLNQRQVYLFYHLRLFLKLFFKETLPINKEKRIGKRSN